MKSVYAWTKEFQSLEIATFPVHYRNKTPKVRWEQYQANLPSDLDLLKWFAGGSLHNYGVVAGWHDLVILDFDNLNRYYDWYLWTLDKLDIAGLASKVKTARGTHIYFSIPDVKANMHIEGLDIKVHGYVLGPGSTHPSGAIYEPIGDNRECMIIPRALSLESVIPADWFQELQNSTTPAHPVYQPHSDDDPFTSASHPLKSDVDLVHQVRARYKIQDFLKGCIKTGQHWYMALCPFHPDKHPSMWVDDLKQICNCNKCNFPKPLDIINLYAKLNHMDERHSILSLAHL